MAVTVYELIQELSKYNADDEVEFHLKDKMTFDTKAEFDRNNEEDTQEVTVDIDIDDDFQYDGVRLDAYGKCRKVFIDLEH